MRTIRQCRTECNQDSEYYYNVQVWESTDAGESFHYSGIGKFFTREQTGEKYDFIKENRTPLRAFPVVTKEIQKSFEGTDTRKEVPCICGYYGRACRQMGVPEGANRALCTGCPLAEYAEKMEMRAYAFS